VRTVVLGPLPAQFAELIEHRRASGADLYDEVWQGEYHMAPAPPSAHGRVYAAVAAVLHGLARPAGLFDSGPFNLGEPDDYRVPDHGVFRDEPRGTWIPTAAVVVEVVSPDDETWAKLPFYAARGVEEVLIVDPRERSVSWLGLRAGGYAPIERSVLGITAAELAAEIDWPEAS
jgi:Uma2 family endonuclease